MQPEVFNTYKSIAQLPAQVSALYEAHRIPVRPATDLARMLALCINVDAKVSNMGKDELLAVCHAKRVLLAIVNCADETEIKAPLERIAAHRLDPASPLHSAGKDAVFELEFLQYIRQRRLTARLGEPDIIVQAPFGDYFVACKTINSLKGLKRQLRSGYGQVEKYGHGCVALNFEPHMSFKQPLCTDTAADVILKLDTLLKGLYKNNTRVLEQKLKDGRLDGVVLQISCFVDIAKSLSDLDVFTHTIYFSRSNLQEREARDRFNGFKFSMQGPLGQPNWFNNR